MPTYLKALIGVACVCLIVPVMFIVACLFFLAVSRNAPKTFQDIQKPPRAQQGMVNPVFIPRLTQAQFDRLKDGMTYEQASEVMGRPAHKEITNQVSGGIETRQKVWESGDSAIYVIFNNGKLKSKSAHNLQGKELIQ